VLEKTSTKAAAETLCGKQSPRGPIAEQLRSEVTGRHLRMCFLADIGPSGRKSRTLDLKSEQRSVTDLSAARQTRLMSGSSDLLGRYETPPTCLSAAVCRRINDVSILRQRELSSDRKAMKKDEHSFILCLFLPCVMFTWIVRGDLDVALDTTQLVSVTIIIITIRKSKYRETYTSVTQSSPNTVWFSTWSEACEANTDRNIAVWGDA
ncbi:hypothetical protein KUCAC02_022219, partial [Chaenocephalus aceratus]